MCVKSVTSFKMTFSSSWKNILFHKKVFFLKNSLFSWTSGSFSGKSHIFANKNPFMAFWLRMSLLFAMKTQSFCHLVKIYSIISTAKTSSIHLSLRSLVGSLCHCPSNVSSNHQFGGSSSIFACWQRTHFQLMNKVI